MLGTQWEERPSSLEVIELKKPIKGLRENPVLSLEPQLNSVKIYQ